MPKKPEKELLEPLGGDPEVDYIRSRLKRRVAMELGITMRRQAWMKLMHCLDNRASLVRISELHKQIKGEIDGPVWGLEVEPLMIERHGAWRYEGRPEIMAADMQRAARFYAIASTMDALLKDCGFQFVRAREERLDDAAWYAIPESER